MDQNRCILAPPTIHSASLIEESLTSSTFQRMRLGFLISVKQKEAIRIDSEWIVWRHSNGQPGVNSGAGRLLLALQLNENDSSHQSR